MLNQRFNLLELTNLALGYQETGVVNFSILHTVITTLIKESGLGDLKPACIMHDEDLDQAAVAKERIERPGNVGRRHSNFDNKDETKGWLMALMAEEDPASRVTQDVVWQIALERDPKKEIGSSSGNENVFEEGKNEEAAQTVSIKTEEGKCKRGKDKIEIDESELFSKSQEAGKIEKSKEDISKEKKNSENVESDVEVVKEVLDEMIKYIEVNDKETDAETMIIDFRKYCREDKSSKSKEEPEIPFEESSKSKEEPEIPFDEATVMNKLQETAKMEEVWQAIHIHRRMKAVEAGISTLSSISDEISDKLEDMEEQNEEMIRKMKTMLEEVEKFVDRMNVLDENSKTHSLRIDDSNEQRATEVKRLEDMILELTRNQQNTTTDLENLLLSQEDFEKQVVHKIELEALKTEVYNVMDLKLKESRKLLREVEDSLVKKDDYGEIVKRVEELEESTVSREEMGKFLEPGFINSFLEEMDNIRKELEELKIRVDQLEKSSNALATRIDEEVVKTMESNFADVNSRLEEVDAKLFRLDPDEINDSFVNMEEQADMIIKELEELKATSEQFQREAKISINKIDNYNELLSKLERTKIDKTRMYELLEQKADTDLIMNKLDRSEFVSVVGEMKEFLERLNITVKISEEERDQKMLEIEQELSLKMYSEEFDIATEPLLNRIKALKLELKRVKEISLTHLFPDAAGIAKCISCNRGAHMAGRKYQGDAKTDLVQEIPVESNIKIPNRKAGTFNFGTAPDSTKTKLPLIDIDSVPISPPDKPREKDPLGLPALFPEARSKIGLAHEMRRSAIDKKVAAYFATRPVRPYGGEYTRTLPQQRGVNCTSVMMPQQEKKDLMLTGSNKGIYRVGTRKNDKEKVDDDSKDCGQQDQCKIKARKLAATDGVTQRSRPNSDELNSSMGQNKTH